MGLRSFIFNFRNKYRRNKLIKEHLQDINNSFSKLKEQKELTTEQEKEIKDYFKEMLGIDVPTDEHRYYYARTGLYSKKYIPTAIYHADLIGRMNVYPLKRFYTDKNNTDKIFPNIKQPHVFLKNINGYYYYEGEPVTIEQAVEKCANIGIVMLKPTRTSHGDGIKKLYIHDGKDADGKNLRDIFEEYSYLFHEFLLQEFLVQHADMAKLNPTSVNTLRILTYRMGMDIKVLYTIIRIGRKDQIIDNMSAGGISTKINSDGTLRKYAFANPGDDYIEKTDSGVVLEGYKIPFYKETIEVAKKAHYFLPYFNLVGWDFAIAENGEPTLIEFNISPDLLQSSGGPAFGEFTDDILKDIMKKPNTWTPELDYAMWR